MSNDDYFSFFTETEKTAYLLSLASQRHQRLTNATLKPLGLTHLQCQLLTGLVYLEQRQDHIVQNDLIRLFELNKSMVSAVIKKLVDKNYIHRTESETDSRAKELSITPSGHAILKKALPLAQAINEMLFLQNNISLEQLNLQLGLINGISIQELDDELCCAIAKHRSKKS